MQQTREKYILAWNDTMTRIWKERLMLLGIYDTGALYNSITHAPVRADGRYWNMTFQFQFLQYGIYVDRGTSGKTRRGNSGDWGDYARSDYTDKKPRRWFSNPWYSSRENLKDFLAAQVGEEFKGAFEKIES